VFRVDGELGDAELDELVEQATVDAYDDEEQLTGLYTMLAEHLAVPFKTVVLGVEVTVKKVDLLPGSRISTAPRPDDTRHFLWQWLRPGEALGFLAYRDRRRSSLSLTPTGRAAALTELRAHAHAPRTAPWA
jgi:hypothetical protein